MKRILHAIGWHTRCLPRVCKEAARAWNEADHLIRVEQERAKRRRS